jgi:hypothetical protein
VPRCLATAPSTMHYLDRLHRPSFGAIGWVRIRSPKCAKHRQHSLGIDKAAESTMLRELSGAPDLGELIEPGSVFSANQPTVRPNSHRPLQTARRLSPRSPRTARMTEPVPGSTPVLGSATKRPWFPIEGMAMVLPQRIQRSAGQTRLDAIFLPACFSPTGRSNRAPSRIGIQPNPALPTSIVNLALRSRRPPRLLC